MMLKKWDKLPPEMQTEEVRKYYDILKKKQVSLFFKRVFDIVASSIMLIILSPVFLIRISTMTFAYFTYLPNS